MSTTTTTSPGLVLFGKTRRAILALLFGHPDEEFHLRDIIRLARVGHGAAQRELQELTAAGLLTRRAKGNLTLYRVNRSSTIYAELHALVMKTVGLAEVLRGALQPISDRIRVAFIYGSIAAGRETVASDVDLLVIGDVTLDEVVAALLDSQEHIGREINPNIYSPQSFTERLRASDRFLMSVLKESKVYVVGDDDELTELAGEGLAAAIHPFDAGDR